MNSINTNFGASIALQSLNKTNRELDAVQKRVSTGYRVADAKDDGAAFAVAQGLRAQVKGNEAVSERLANAKGLLSVSLDSLKMISDVTGEIRTLLVKMIDENTTTAERVQYDKEFSNLHDDIFRLIDQAEFNGQNLLYNGTTVTSSTYYNANTVSTVMNENGGSLTINIEPISGSAAWNLTRWLNLATDIVQSDQAELILTPNPPLSASRLGNFEHHVRVAIGRLSASYRAVTNQENMISKMSDALNFGIGAIADADMAKESARMQSLQIRQQLGTQALSLANQKPSALLDLFR